MRVPHGPRVTSTRRSAHRSMRRSAHLSARRSALLALVALLAGLVPFGPAAADHYNRTEEIGGETNVQAAVSFSQAVFPDTSDEALLARDDNFPDALASGLMQSSRPLLYTNTNELSPETRAELERLEVSTVHILGGTAAVSSEVEQELTDAGYTVRRISVPGGTRIDTAVEVARRHASAATTAIVAAAFAPEGATDPTRAFADSIAAGGWSAAASFPVLLTETNRLSGATSVYLQQSTIATVNIVGGTAAVSEQTEQQIEALGIVVQRVSGPSRFHTAVEIARARGVSSAVEASRVILNEGQEASAWAPGFAAAAYAKSASAPIVLSNGEVVPEATATFLRAPSSGSPNTQLTCSPRVDPSACAASAELMGQTAEVSGEFPQLVQVALGQATDDEQKVHYTFSDVVAPAIQASRMKLYRYDAEPVLATSAERDQFNNRAIIATFPKDEADEATVAAVASGAATGLNGRPVPDASVALRGFELPGGDPGAPVVTEARCADCVATNGSRRTWRVEVEFDRPLTRGNDDFTLVMDKKVDSGQLDGTTSVPTQDDVAAFASSFVFYHSGANSNMVTVDFPVDGDLRTGDRDVTPVTDESVEASFSESSVRRLFVHRGAVSATNARAGAAQVVQVNSSRETDGPDLVSITQSGADWHFKFNKALSNGTDNPALFRLYAQDGTAYTPSSVARSGSDTTVYVATLTDGANIMVAGSVSARAVTTPTSGTGLNTEDGIFNAVDSRPITNTFASGTTAAPAISSFSRATTPNPSMTITFNKTVTRTNAAGKLFVFDEEGEATEITGCTATTATGGSTATVTCAPSAQPQRDAIAAADAFSIGQDFVRWAGNSGTMTFSNVEAFRPF